MNLYSFLKQACDRERADLAAGCNVPVFYLYQIAENQRLASPLMAGRIEQISRVVANGTAGRLETVPQLSLLQSSGPTRNHKGCGNTAGNQHK
ncbi:MAG: hypothetical protein OXD01_15080 [Gammaproteobacteria bacterium]|nr:hypothetical protein [Gammaproteobacteria bacterium]